jgi:raffinose/stachyose/melibiose transport system substrate-binding protein
MLKKSRTFLGLVLAIALGLPGSVAAEKVTLTFVIPNTTNTTAYEQIFAAYKAKTGAEVEIQALPPGEDYGRLLLTRFNTGDYPDLFEMDPGTKQYTKFRGDETLFDWAKDPILSRLTASTREFQTLGGHVYGIAWGSTGAYGVYYNKAVFKALGKAPPANYAEFLDIAKAAKAAGYIPIYEAAKTGWPLQVFSLIGWPSYVDPAIGDTGVQKLERNQLRLNQIPELKNLLARQYDLSKKGFYQDSFLAGTYEEQQELFGQGRVAMVAQIPVFISAMEQKFGKQFVTDNLGWFPLPSDKGKGVATLSPASQILVPRLGKNVKAATDLVRFMTEKANVDILYKTIPGIPVYNDAAVALYPAQEDVLACVKEGRAKINMQNRLSSSLTDYPKILQALLMDGDVDKALATLDENYRKTGKARVLPGF